MQIPVLEKWKSVKQEPNPVDIKVFRYSDFAVLLHLIFVPNTLHIHEVFMTNIFSMLFCACLSSNKTLMSEDCT